MRTTCWWSKTTSPPCVGNANASCRRRPFPPERTECEKGHGRLEERALLAREVAGAEVSFPHARQIARLDRRRTDLRTGEVSQESLYLITSLEPSQADAARLGALARAHWSIENQLHWRRDWSYDEDRSRIRHPTGARVMCALRNLAIAWHTRASPYRHRARQRCLPQQQRQLAARPQTAIAAMTRPWKA